MTLGKLIELPDYEWIDYNPVAGDLIVRDHPFTKMAAEHGVDERWRPGAWGSAFNGIDSFHPFCHAEGRVRIRVLHVADVKGYPRRVLYCRRFIMPGGVAMKRSGMLTKSIGQFRKYCREHSSYGYDVSPDERPVSVDDNP